jgi:hypothetical protein
MVPKDRFAPSLITLIVFLALLIGSVYLAAQTQQDFGNVEVSNVCYPNFNGIPIRAKLLRPRVASKDNPLPGAIYIHGYQNNRETGDAYCLELARRGFVVLNIDAIGRGNSGMPNDLRIGFRHLRRKIIPGLHQVAALCPSGRPRHDGPQHGCGNGV